MVHNDDNNICNIFLKKKKKGLLEEEKRDRDSNKEETYLVVRDKEETYLVVNIQQDHCNATRRILQQQLRVIWMRRMKKKG